MIGVKTLPSASGVEKVVEEIGSRLVARGHEVTVFTRAHLSTDGSREYRGMRVQPTWSIPTKNLDAVTHSVAAALALAPDTDVVHVHTTNFAPAIAISRLRQIPVVVQSHGLDWRRAKWGKAASAYLWASDAVSRHWSHGFLVVSRALEHAYASRAGQPPIYVPNGVARWTPESRTQLASLGLDGRKYVLFAARLVPEKGCHLLLKAFEQLRPENTELVIAGDDMYRGSYAEGLKASAGPHVHFVGAILGAQFRALVQHAEVFVLPSEIEGLSTGLLEAMAARRCIVASDLPENREALGDAGITFPSGNADALAGALASALKSESMRAQLGAAAARRVFSLYDWDMSTTLVEKTYEAALGARRAGRTAAFQESA